MHRIKEDRVSIRPRGYFVLGTILLGIGLAGALLTALFALGLVLFQIRSAGPFDYLGLGRLGFPIFLRSFPWLASLIALAGITAGLTLIRRFDFSYKIGLVGIVVGLATLLLTLGFLLDRSGFSERAIRHRYLPRTLRTGLAGKSWIAGQVSTVGESHLEITTPLNERVTLIWNEKTLLPEERTFKVGDYVRALGQREGNVFHAHLVSRGGIFRHSKLTPQMQGYRNFRSPPNHR